MFSKLSLCFVYRDLLRYVDFPAVNISRVVNYVLMVVLIGFFTAATVIGIFACTPIEKSWFRSKPGHCIDTQIMFNYVTSSVNISTSILLICIPMPVLYLAKNKRIEIKQLIGLVLLGLMFVPTPLLYPATAYYSSDTIISAIRLYMISGLHQAKSDYTCTFPQYWIPQRDILTWPDLKSNYN